MEPLTRKVTFRTEKIVLFRAGKAAFLHDGARFEFPCNRPDWLHPDAVTVRMELELTLKCRALATTRVISSQNF